MVCKASIGRLHADCVLAPWACTSAWLHDSACMLELNDRFPSASACWSHEAIHSAVQHNWPGRGFGSGMRRHLQTCAGG